MGFLKKTIMLTNKNKGITYGMAVLSIQKNNGGVFGNLRSYDFKGDNLVLGISCDGKQVIKQSVMFSQTGNFDFKLKNTFDINANISGVLVDIAHDKVVPLAWGSNNAKADYKENIINIVAEDYYRPKQIETTKSVQVKQIDKQTQIQQIKEQLFEEPAKDELEQFIDHEIDKSDRKEVKEFYKLIQGQLEDLFDTYPEDEVLEGIVPSSKWVRVDYENDGKEYVVGLIMEDDQVKYICYGVPGSFAKMPPANLQQYSQWLPINIDNPEGEGYWIMYQDAMSGDSVEVSA